MSDKPNPALPTVAIVQGIYYFFTGIWAVLHRPSFELVTGPKTDYWLVRTVGWLLALLGAIFALAGWKKRVTLELALVAGGTAAVLGGVDTVYALRGRIRKIYLLDAVGELGFLGAWALLPFLESQQEGR